MNRKHAAVAIAAIILLAALLAFYDASAPEADQADQGPEPAKWTVMYWTAYDNNIGTWGAGTGFYNDTQLLPPCDDVNIVWLWDDYHSNDTKLLHIRNGNLSRYDLTWVYSDKFGEEFEDINEIDTSNVTNLYKFVNWTVQRFPAKYYNLRLQNHGGAWRGVCSDDQSYDNPTQHEIVNDFELRWLFEKLTEEDIIIDLLSYDACYMASIEAFCALPDSNPIYVGGSETMLWSGSIDLGETAIFSIDHYALLSMLFQNPDASPIDFINYHENAFCPVKMWADPWGYVKPYTTDCYSVLLNSPLKNELREHIDELAAMITDYLPQLRERITLVLDPSYKYSNSGWEGAEEFDFLWNFAGISRYPMYDLADFCIKLALLVEKQVNEDWEGDLYAALCQAQEMITRFVVLNLHGTDRQAGEHPGASGLSVYFPMRTTSPTSENEGMVGYDPAYDETLWAQETRWDEMVKAYILMED